MMSQVFGNQIPEPVIDFNHPHRRFLCHNCFKSVPVRFSNNIPICQICNSDFVEYITFPCDHSHVIPIAQNPNSLPNPNQWRHRDDVPEPSLDLNSTLGNDFRAYRQTTGRIFFTQVDSIPSFIGAIPSILSPNNTSTSSNTNSQNVVNTVVSSLQNTINGSGLNGQVIPIIASNSNTQNSVGNIVSSIQNALNDNGLNGQVIPIMASIPTPSSSSNLPTVDPSSLNSMIQAASSTLNRFISNISIPQGQTAGNYFVGSNSEFQRFITSMMGGNPGDPPATSAQLKLLESIGFSDAIKDKSCPICLESFTNSMALSQMPCSHIYHHECLIKWLKLHNRCPSCQKQLPEIPESSHLPQEKP